MILIGIFIYLKCSKNSSTMLNNNNSELLYKKPDGYKNVNAQSYIIIVKS